ncbi:hypothetical protein G9A89_012682 [Geosiphon pyriformis]|nr:hypothetical protein G9A89_012682 [Geosiphon pyriformis]
MIKNIARRLKLIVSLPLLVISLTFLLPNINASFGYGVEKIRGVNLGGWLVLEPWITPSLFDQFLNTTTPAVDEWTFTEVLGREEAQRQLKKHWNTWVTKKDIQQLASYGINHVRIPIGYWAFDIQPGEPFVDGAFQYLLKAIIWAQTYKLKVIVDLHGAPGSQNGFDNSGRRGQVLWQTGSPDNVPRTIRVLQTMTKRLLPYQDTVTAINILNEPLNWGGNQIEVTRKFYLDTYKAIRAIGSQALIVIHDTFLAFSEWQGFMQKPEYEGQEIANSNNNLWTVIGEWSLASNDCTKWLNGFKAGARYDGTLNENPPICPTCTCKGDDDYQTYSPDYKKFLRNFVEAQMDSFEAGVGWLFWNFKAEKAPQWNYMLGVEQGWIPENPANRSFHC